LRWADGLCTAGLLTISTLNEWEAHAAEWRRTAYADPFAPEILGPAPLPSVELLDPEVAWQGDGAPPPLLGRLAAMTTTLVGAGLEHVETAVGAVERERILVSSKGLDEGFGETYYSCSASAGMLYSRGFSKRRAITETELADMLEDVRLVATALSESDDPPDGLVPILLPPGAAGSFLGRFVGANLSGTAVVNGRGAFTLDDFRQYRQVLRPDISVVVDSLLPFERAASPISSEGVPGGRVTLVGDGRLVTPSLGLRSARMAGMPPTPMAGGPPAMLVQSSRDWLSPEAALAEMAAGVVVYSVLGMNGQDAASGAYSVVSPQARVVRHGRAGGRAKIVLAGNFLDHLRDDRTRFVRYPWRLNPGLLIWTTIHPDRS
jgi:predicted Zn-dependent protease